MTVMEDVGGYFCGRCGRESCTRGPDPGEEDEKCVPPVRSGDLHWAVIVETLKDSLSFDDTESSRVFHFNQETRKRTLFKIESYLADQGRAYRIRNGERL